MVLYLNRARSENLGFNDVCSSLQKFNNLAARQQKVVEERDAARNGMFSLTDLQTESEARVEKFLQSGSNRDRDSAEFAVNMEILSPIVVHQAFVSEQVDADGSPFARSNSSSESAKNQTSEARARGSAKRAEESEILKRCNKLNCNLHLEWRGYQ